MSSGIPEWVAGYIGIPYETGGRDRSGIDCWGLFNLVWAEQFGRPLPSYEGTLWHAGSSSEEVGRAAEEYSRRFRKIPSGEERLGDGILIRVIGHPLHLAMVVADGWMLHIEALTDSCVTPYRSFSWEKRISSFYRYD